MLISYNSEFDTWSEIDHEEDDDPILAAEERQEAARRRDLLEHDELAGELEEDPRRRPGSRRERYELREERRQRMMSIFERVHRHEPLRKLSGCSLYPVQCEDCGILELRPDSCDYRLCPHCAARRARRQHAKYWPIVSMWRRPRMLTLTVPTCPEGELLERVQDIKKWFARLRKRKVFRQVLGGVWGLEILPSETIGYWHVHIHALIEGWVENREEYGRPLERAWAQITRPAGEGRRSVRLDRVQGWDGLSECVKYPYKMSGKELNRLELLSCDRPSMVHELLDVVERKGIKFCEAWGCARRVKPERAEGEEAEEYNALCLYCGGELQKLYVTIPHGDNRIGWTGKGAILKDKDIKAVQRRKRRSDGDVNLPDPGG